MASKLHGLLSRFLMLMGAVFILIYVRLVWLLDLSKEMVENTGLFSPHVASRLFHCDECAGKTSPAKAIEEETSDTRTMTQQSPRRRLEFLHIPKTGGTAIESMAARHGVVWGMCHFVFNQEAGLRISNDETNCPPEGRKHNWQAHVKHGPCPWWHWPAQFFEDETLPPNPYQDADLFAVVRNPYDRILSEYYYMMTHVLKKSANDTNYAPQLNAYIQRGLGPYSKNAIGGYVAKKIPSNNAYFMNSGHFIPQYDYIFDHRRRMVQHVLKFENLTAEFDALMDQYNLTGLRMPQKQVRPSHTKQLGVYNLTRSTLELIERLYQNDFYEFDYEMVSSNIPTEVLDRNDKLMVLPAKRT